MFARTEPRTKTSDPTTASHSRKYRLWKHGHLDGYGDPAAPIGKKGPERRPIQPERISKGGTVKATFAPRPLIFVEIYSVKVSRAAAMGVRGTRCPLVRDSAQWGPIWLKGIGLNSGM